MSTGGTQPPRVAAGLRGIARARAVHLGGLAVLAVLAGGITLAPREIPLLWLALPAALGIAWAALDALRVGRLRCPACGAPFFRDPPPRVPPIAPVCLRTTCQACGVSLQRDGDGPAGGR